MRAPTIAVAAAWHVVTACASLPESSSCAPVAPAAYILEVPVGDASLPGRLDLLCVNGRAWGRLLIVAGGDTLTGAVSLARHEADTAAFASGGGIVGVSLVRGVADSAQGVIRLAGGRSFAFRGAVDPAGPAIDLAAHAVLEPARPNVVSTDSGESYPVPLAGGAILFTRHGADLGRQRLMLAPADGPPRPLLDTPDGVTDRSPSIAPDGAVLLFASNRDPANPAGVREHTTLWFMRATGDGWSAPRPVMWPAADDPASPQQPVLTPDGTLYFVDDREDGLGGRDVYRARWEDGAVSNVARVGPPVSTPADEAGLHVSADGRTLVVSRAAGPGHQGGDDLYVHTRSDGGWSEPANVGLPVNTFANEYGPWLSADGARLWFASDRFGSGDLLSVAVSRGADGSLSTSP